MTNVIIPDFQVYSSALEPLDTKALHPLFTDLPESTEDMPILTVVSSSTEQDLYGDIMSITALQDMCNAPVGQSVFRDHSYSLPNDYLGKTVTRSVMVSDGHVTDLHDAFGIYMKDENNAKSYDQIVSFKARHGVSVGICISEYHYNGDVDDWFAPIIIDRLYLVERSLVGIPASQRSWVENAIGGVFERHVRDDNGEEALRLAPAYKGLFPNNYKELVKSLRSEGLRKELEKCPVRSSTQKLRLGWEPLKKHFVFQHGNRSQVVERAAIPDLLKTYSVHRVSSEETVETKGASGKTSWPLMGLNTEWTGSKATKQIFAWAKNDDGEIVASKAKQCHLHFDPDKTDVQDGYSFPFCYVEGDSPKIVPLGVHACAGILNGGMGGTKADDQEAMKAKCETMYGRINSELKPDPEWVVPWKKKDDDKAMTTITTKAIEDIEVDEDGKHEATTGKHTHKHTDGNGDTHSHEHEHDNDANHADHSHDSENTPDSDGDGDGDTKSLEPAVTTPDPVRFYQLTQLNTIGTELFGESWQALSFTDFRVKEGRELSSSNMAKIKIAHDILAEMGGNDVCTCQGGNSGNLDNDDDENDGATRDYAPLFEALSAQTKAIGDFIEAVKSLGSLEEKQQALQASLKAVEDSVELYNKELAALQIKQKKAVQDVNNLADSVTALKNMPLGDPRALAGRSVTQQLGVVDLKDMLPVNQEHWTLEDCLAQTSKTVKTLGDGTTLTYRHWPSGVGKGLQGEVEGGVRPPLSNAQKTRMSVASRMDYEAGLESFVPVTPNDDLEDILARQR